jgi:hypothetical protein
MKEVGHIKDNALIYNRCLTKIGQSFYENFSLYKLSIGK